MATSLIDRRHFLATAGALFSSVLSTSAKAAFAETQAIYASAYVEGRTRFGVAIMSERGELLAKIPLPARGHDVIFSPDGLKAIVFARRPGTFAAIFDPRGGEKLHIVYAPSGRHFYGHGVFSADGRLLYATENNFENAAGKVAIYLMGGPPERIGEFDSFGIGPHEVALMPDQSTLVIANGGIETHPDYGRTKLNLSSMKPNLAFIDRGTGDLIELHDLPVDLHQVSVRHLVAGSDGWVYFGGQYQGPKWEAPPLIGRARLGEGLQFWNLDETRTRGLSNYIGSVALSADGERLAASAPRGNRILILSAQTGSVMSDVSLERGCGLAALGQSDFLASSERGAFLSVQDAANGRPHSMHFDNHIGRS